MVKTPRRSTRAGSKASTSKTSTQRSNTPNSSRTTSSSARSSESTRLEPKPKTIDLDPKEVRETSSSSTTRPQAQGSPAKSKTASAASSSAAASKASASVRPTRDKSTVSDGSKASAATSAKPENNHQTKPSSSANQESKRAAAASTGSAGISATSKSSESSYLLPALAGAAGGVAVLLGGLALWGAGVFSDDEQSAEILARLNALDTELGSLESRLSELPTEVPPDLSAPLGVLQETMNALQSGDGERASAISDLQSQIADAQSAVSQLEAMLTQAETESATNASDLIALQESIKALQTQQANLEEAVASGESGEAPALAAIDTQMTQLTQAQGELLGQFSNIQAQLVAMQDSIAANETAENAAATTEALQAEMSAQLLAQARDFDEKLAAQASSLDQLKASFSALPGAGLLQSSGMSNGMALGYAAQSLNDARSDSAPFAALLLRTEALLNSLDSPFEVPDELRAAAENGLTSLSEIGDKLEAEASARLLAMQPDPSQSAAVEETPAGLLNTIMSGARNLVTVRDLSTPEAEESDLLGLAMAEAILALQDENAATSVAALSEMSAAYDASGETSALLDAELTGWQFTAKGHQQLGALIDHIGNAQHTAWQNSGGLGQ